MGFTITMIHEKNTLKETIIILIFSLCFPLFWGLYIGDRLNGKKTK